MTAENWSIGQTMPIERQAIHTGAGHPRWHVLVTPPQREEHAEAWLHRRGVYAFHPVRRKVSRVRGREVERWQRYLPGYVFARFPHRVIRHRVLVSPFITGAVCMQSGEWGIIPPASLRGIHSMKRPEGDGDPARRRADMIRPGDRVRILSGLCGVGQVVEVHELKAGRACVSLPMFGADVPAQIDVDRLERVGLLAGDE